jgi:hypothetical protein
MISPLGGFADPDGYGEVGFSKAIPSQTKGWDVVPKVKKQGTDLPPSVPTPT